MAIIAGIDEAGYGPTLGPLIVSGVAFRVPDDATNDCLWQRLKNSCTAKPTRRVRKIVIADSKKLYKPRSSLAPLERTALVMLAVAGKQPTTWLALLADLTGRPPNDLGAYPWYAKANPSLPLSEGVGDIATQANAVRRDCAAQNVQLIGVYSEPLLEGQFNRLVRNTDNKATVLMGLTLRIMQRIMAMAQNEPVRICVDRQGGRSHYRDTLMTSWPDHQLAVLEESPARSAYRLEHDPQQCDVEFVTKGEDRFMPVALASIYSKYLRESFMRAFNAHWSKHIDGIKPTAGYYTDAQRWLRDASPTLNALSIDRSILVRER